MKIFFIIFAFLLFSPQFSFALSDVDHKAFLKESDAYKNNDRYLQKVWSAMKKNLPNEKYKTILKDQLDWIKIRRDKTAQVFMDNGFSRLDSYNYATTVRICELEHYYFINLKKR